MNETATDVLRREAIRGTTTSGVGSAAQLVDFTPYHSLIIESTAFSPFISLKFVQPGFLTEEDEPVLARIWDNDSDTIFDL